jgi:hypothetical protein
MASSQASVTSGGLGGRRSRSGGCERIAIHLLELRQLFNSMDPSPFHERDLDANAEEFIVGWALETPPKAPLCLDVHLDRSAGRPDEGEVLEAAMRMHFRRRVEISRQRLRQLLRRGRTSLFIGLLFLTAAVAAANALEQTLANAALGRIFREGLLIGGWVAMWKPLEILLYDWWPIRAERRLFERLAQMTTRIVYTGHGPSDASHGDWPELRGRPEASG